MRAIMCHDQICKWYLSLLHTAEGLRYMELGACLLLDFLELDIRCELGQGKLTLLPVYLEDGLRAVSVWVSEKTMRRKLTKSVTMVLTTLAPVSGREQFCTILGLPFLSTWSVKTTILVASGFPTRSIAPPMPLKTFPGIM